MFSFYFSTLRQAADLFTTTLNNFVQMSEHDMYLDNFRKVLELQPKVQTGKLNTGLTSLPKIEFRHVSFKYPNTKNTFIRI
jgi:ABC-type multidrug transport system fused ATPase/permease subunit